MINSSTTYSKYRKIQIYPNAEQRKYLDYCINTARYVYNWALNIENEQYEKYLAGEATEQFVHERELRNLYSAHLKENDWLKDFQIEPARYIFSRIDYAFEMFFRGHNNHPKFKTRKREHFKNKHSIRIRHDRVYFDGSYVRLPGFHRGEMIDCRFDTNMYMNDNIQFHHVDLIKDNLDNYFIGFWTEAQKPITYFKDNNIPQLARAIGIDINLKRERRFVCSDGSMFVGRNVSCLKKHIADLNSKVSKAINRLSEMEKTNPDAKLSKRAEKNIKKFRKANRRMHNIQEDEVQKFTKAVINKNPSCVVMETLPIRYEMKKTKPVARMAHFIPLFRYREVMEYKCNQYNIPFKLADRTFPSTQTCSNCGARRKLGSKRVYECKVCGFKIDRDLNAAINLENLAYL